MEIYHEQQHLRHCLQHALNNLLQQPLFTVAALNQIADNLAPNQKFPLLHPHRSLLGNYDVNVLEIALESVGRSLRWHDARDSTFQTLNLASNNSDGNDATDNSAMCGLIVNLMSPGLISNLMGGRHWLALRKFDGKWFNLDSRLRQPEVLVSSDMEEDEDEVLRVYLSRLQQESNAIVFVIS